MSITVTGPTTSAPLALAVSLGVGDTLAGVVAAVPTLTAPLLSLDPQRWLEDDAGREPRRRRDDDDEGLREWMVQSARQTATTAVIHAAWRSAGEEEATMMIGLCLDVEEVGCALAIGFGTWKWELDLDSGR
jgi:hypothetical protein